MPETSLRIRGKTGQRCRESGPYRSAGPAGVVLFMTEGQQFPPDVDGSETVWTLVAEDDDEE